MATTTIIRHTTAISIYREYNGRIFIAIAERGEIKLGMEDSAMFENDMADIKEKYAAENKTARSMIYGERYPSSADEKEKGYAMMKDIQRRITDDFEELADSYFDDADDARDFEDDR